MATIKAPYNFVPFNKKVVSPHWIEQISHDIPFADGLSGTMEVILKAESPIFVRDGIGQKQAKENYQNDIQQNPHQFSQYDSRYFIPGTSIKGMIRNVLEILSFGRMEDKVNDHRYAVRDFHNKILYDPSKISQHVKCGWLSFVNGEYLLQDCGKPRRISHKALSEHFNNNISAYFQKKSNLGDKSAKMKYSLYSDIQGSYNFETWDDRIGRPMCKISSNGNFRGTIVFTGQPSERIEDQGKGKHLEFVFQDHDIPGNPVSDRIIENFFFAYYDHDKNKQSPDWKYWKPKLDAGENIPVFFRKENDVVKDIGLSMLYKIAYENSVLDAISHFQGVGLLDLSEAIFGHVDKNNSLKGRVHIGHAFAIQKPEVDEEKKEVLSGPKASYYPSYIRQEVNHSGAVNLYKTFMNKEAEIAGWKRYPVHANGVKRNQPPPNTNSEKIITRFTPLKAGAEFTFTIRYHNLRPVELGALLSALTFHGTEHTFHSIGMAKPLGYGKVTLTIKNAKDLDIPKYLGSFEAYMNMRLDQPTPSWNTMEQVVELVTMAQDQADADFNYMTLTEHVTAKKDKEGLVNYSKLVSNKAQIGSYCDAADISAMKKVFDKDAKDLLHSDNIDEVVEMTRSAAKGEIYDLWESKKALLLQKLNEKQTIIGEYERLHEETREAETRARKREEIKKQVEVSGPGLNQVDISNRRSAMDNLVKTVESYGRKYYQQSDIRKVIQQNPSGYLPEKFHELLIFKLVEIFQILTSKDREKWNLPYNNNAMRKKVAEWIGKEKAQNITFK